MVNGYREAAYLVWHLCWKLAQPQIGLIQKNKLDRAIPRSNLIRYVFGGVTGDIPPEAPPTF